MSEGIAPCPGLTRRSFLKTTGVLAGVAAAGTAVMPKLQALAEEGGRKTSSEDQVFHGVCRGNCMNGCPLEIHVRGGKVARVRNAECPDPQYNRICLKGITHPQRIYSPDRPLYPMKRVGERGSGEFERITWEEAIGTICSKWEELRKEHGPAAIGFWSQSGSFGLLNGCHYLGAYNRLMGKLGAIPISGAIDMNYYTASSAMYGGGLSGSYNEITDLRNARTVIAWGTNFTEAQMQSWHFLADAIEAGCKVVVIDPSFTTLASKADLFVPIRPGSDAVLAFAMANILIEEDLIDVPFLLKSTVAPFLVKEDGTYLRMSDLGVAPTEGPVNAQTGKPSVVDPIVVWDEAKGEPRAEGEAASPALKGSYQVEGHAVRTAYDLLLDRIREYPPEVATDICDVPIETMREIVRLYTGNKPASIFQGFGYDRYYNGHSTFTAIGAFAMLSGNIGKPGSSAGICQPGPIPIDMSRCFGPIRQVANVDDSVVDHGQSSYTAGVLAHKLLEALETGMYNGSKFVMKSIYINNCNPLNYVVDRQTLIKVFDKMELVVTADIRMTDTSPYADIVLPAAHWFEVDDFTCGTAFLTPYVCLQEKAVEPPGECKSDYEILNLLAKGMGWPEVYDDLSPQEAMQYLLDTDTAKKYGVTWERLQREKIIRWFPEEEYIYGADGTFSTPTKRAQFYFEKLTPSMDWGQEIDEELERLPFFIPPQEAWPENPLFEKYPLTCLQEHTRWRVHSNFSEVPWLRELDPEPTVKINPVDAKARGIVDGDMVRVFNDRGQAVVKAILSEGIRPGMCNMPKGWQACQYVEGHYNDLSSRETNPYVANSQFSDLLVEIEKA